MNRNSALVLALICGCLLPLQTALNTILGEYADGAIFGALGAFIVGLAAIVMLFASGLMGRGDWQAARQAPWWAWCSGFVGAFYIVSTILVTPVVGLTVASAATVAGQLSSALVVDHFGWIGFHRSRLTAWRVVGALFLLVGVVLLLSGQGESVSNLPLAGVALLGGVCITVGLGMSNTLRSYMGTPISPTLVNFVLGSIALVIITALGVFGHPDFAKLSTMPWWGWLGGLFGVTYVAIITAVAPHIGASLSIASVIAGQMVCSLLLDEIGFAGLAQRPITPLRVAGVCALAAGIWMIQRHSRPVVVSEVAAYDEVSSGS